MKKNNKRTITLIIVFIIFCTLIITSCIKKNNNNFEQKKQLNNEEYLDDGIEYLKFIEENKYTENIIISNIKFNSNNIEFLMENKSNNSVYISNQVTIMVNSDKYNLFDSIDGKIELKPYEKKEVMLDCTISGLSTKLGYYVDVNTMQIVITKPIYERYNSNILIGVAKGKY